MAQETKNDILMNYTSDVHALIEHGLITIKRQQENLKDVSHADAKAAVVAFVGILGHQKQGLAARVKALGGSAATPVKDAVSAVAGVAAGLVNAVRPSEAAKSIRDDHTYFSHLGISWLMLHTTASSLGDATTASLAEEGYSETARAIMRIDALVPKLVVEELRENKSLEPHAVDIESRQMMKKAWDREATTSI